MYVHKIGATLSLAGQIPATNDAGTQPDFTGWTGASQIRTLAGALVADLTFEWLNIEQRKFRLRALNTSGWQVGVAEIDIKLTSSNGEVLITSTQQIQLVKSVTNATT